MVIALVYERAESGENKATLPLSTIDLVISVVDSIMAKGGHCSRDVLKTTIGKGEAMFGWALSAAIEFGLVNYKDKEYLLSPSGDKFSAADVTGRKGIMREIVLSYQPYHTVLLRLKNAPETSLLKSDVTKAWYELNKSGTDRTRQQNTGCFANICEWCGLVENRKKTVVLTEDGKTILAGVSPPKPQAATSGSPTETGPQKKTGGQEPTKPITTIPIPLSATITINISVDTKEQTSVENLLRIIKALKGENGSP